MINVSSFSKQAVLFPFISDFRKNLILIIINLWPGISILAIRFPKITFCSQLNNNRCYRSIGYLAVNQIILFQPLCSTGCPKIGRIINKRTICSSFIIQYIRDLIFCCPFCLKLPGKYYFPAQFINSLRVKNKALDFLRGLYSFEILFINFIFKTCLGKI